MKLAVVLCLIAVPALAQQPGPARLDTRPGDEGRLMRLYNQTAPERDAPPAVPANPKVGYAGWGTKFGQGLPGEEHR